MKQEKKKRQIISIILFLITVPLGAISWLILPDIGCLMNGKLDGKHAVDSSWERVVMGHDNSRGIVLATVGIGIMVLMILINTVLIKLV